MKAIKLASIFAVTAVAAAVSTTTIAAEPVFSGTAALNYTIQDSGDVLDGSGNDPEVELAVDTGLVYAEIEIDGSTGSDVATVDLEAIYVKNGAVSFGKFDGSLSDGAFFADDGVIGGVSTDSIYSAIRYNVAPGLTVGIEGSDAVNADGDSEIGAAVSYEMELGGGATLGLSAGSVGDDTAYNLGFSTSFDALSLNIGFGAGEIGGTDKSQAVIELGFAASDALSFNAQFGTDTEAETDGLQLTASYTVGDIKYYVENETGDFAEYTEIGAKASF